MTRSPRRLKQQVREAVGEQVRDLPLHAVRLAMFGVGRALLVGDRVTRDYKEITEGGGVKPVLGRLAADVQHTAEKVVDQVVELVRGEEPESRPGAESGPGAESKPEPAPRPRGAEPAHAKPGPSAPKGGGEISVGKPSPAPKPEPASNEHGEGKDEDESAERKPEAPQDESASPTLAQPETAAPDPAQDETATPEPAQDAAPESAQPGSAGRDPFDPKPEAKPAAQAEAERVAADLPVPDYDAATLPQLRARLRGLSADQVKLLREYERKHAARPEVVKMYENRLAKLNGQN